MLIQAEQKLTSRLEFHTGCDEPPHEAPIQRNWCPHGIAKLTRLLISLMPSESLIEILEQEYASLPQPGVRKHLKYYDRAMLERLVYLVRNCCRNQILNSINNSSQK